MNAPAARPDARPDLSRKWGPWAYVLRYWNVVRPAWPVPTFTLLTCLMLWLSSQGKEALYAVADFERDTETFLTTYLVVICASIVQYGVFLWAVCGYYKSFSDRAMQGVNVRLWSATIVGMITPTFLVLFYLSPSARPAPDDGSLSEVLNAVSPLLASVLTWGVLLALAIVLQRRWVRLHLSPFSAIARLGARFRTTIITLIVIGVLTAALTQFWPTSARLLGPVGLTVLSLTLWAAAWTRVAIFVEKHGWPPTPALAVFLALVFSLVGPLVDNSLRGFNVGRSDIISFDRNRVDLIERTSAREPAPIEDHAERWLAERRARGGPVRAIVVLAEGGGIRAAVQTATLLGALDSEDSNFFDDLYVVSGVSGGSVGISTYLAAKSEGLENISEAAVEPLEQDHLSPVLATMYFWDWLLAFIPAPTAGFGGLLDYDLHDRGSAFEASLQEAQSRMNGEQPCEPNRGMRFRLWQDNAMACPFLDVVNEAARRENVANAPVVLLNTTRTSDGDNEFVSNVTFGDESRLCNVLWRVPLGQTISLATAAHLSARFPFVSPPGAMRVGRGCQPETMAEPGVIIRYVDGGYLDNSGALSAGDAVAALNRVARGTEIEFVVIHIYTPVVVTSAGPTSNETLPEVTAPLDAVTKARSLQGLGPVINLCRQIEDGLERPARQQACDVIGRRRTLSATEAQTATDTDYETRYVLREAGGRAYWITAPLLVSDGRSASRKQFVPLGWVLGRQSIEYVVTGTRELARTRIGGLLRPNADAPTTLTTP